MVSDTAAGPTSTSAGQLFLTYLSLWAVTQSNDEMPSKFKHDVKAETKIFNLRLNLAYFICKNVPLIKHEKTRTKSAA